PAVRPDQGAEGERFVPLHGDGRPGVYEGVGLAVEPQGLAERPVRPGRPALAAVDRLGGLAVSRLEVQPAAEREMDRAGVRDAGRRPGAQLVLPAALAVGQPGLLFTGGRVGGGTGDVELLQP